MRPDFRDVIARMILLGSTIAVSRQSVLTERGAIMPLQVLTRTISPYDGPDLFLGLFSDASKAQRARDAYLKSVSLTDPWRKQAYRSADLEADVRLVPIQDFRTEGDGSPVVFLVTAYFEEMGQRVRRFLAVFSNPQAAAEFAARQEAAPPEEAPNRCDTDEVVLNVAR
jgi:hypothetical protein